MLGGGGGNFGRSLSRARCRPVDPDLARVDFAQPHTFPGGELFRDELDPGRLQGGGDIGADPTLQRPPSDLELGDRVPGNACPAGELLLTPSQERVGGAALRRRSNRSSNHASP